MARFNDKKVDNYKVNPIVSLDAKTLKVTKHNAFCNADNAKKSIAEAGFPNGAVAVEDSGWSLHVESTNEKFIANASVIELRHTDENGNVDEVIDLKEHPEIIVF